MDEETKIIQDKNGVDVYTDVAYINQRGDVAIKNYPDVFWARRTRSEIYLLDAHYVLQGVAIMKRANWFNRDGIVKNGLNRQIALMLRKAADAFDAAEKCDKRLERGRR